MTHWLYLMLSAMMLTTLACGSGVPIGSTSSVPDIDTTTEPSVSPPPTDAEDSPFLCQLPVVLRRSHGAAGGVVVAMDGPNVGLPRDSADREYWLVTVNVDEAVAGTLDNAVEAAGNMLPEVVAGEPLTFVLYPDLEGTPLASMKDQFESGEQMLVIMQGSGNPEKATEDGRWLAIRSASIKDGAVLFHGICAAELENELSAIASELGREADARFLIDFQAEVLGHYNNLENKGIIEQTAYDLYD